MSRAAKLEMRGVREAGLFPREPGWCPQCSGSLLEGLRWERGCDLTSSFHDAAGVGQQQSRRRQFQAEVGFALFNMCASSAP